MAAQFSCVDHASSITSPAVLVHTQPWSRSGSFPHTKNLAFKGSSPSSGRSVKVSPKFPPTPPFPQNGKVGDSPTHSQVQVGRSAHGGSPSATSSNRRDTASQAFCDACGSSESQSMASQYALHRPQAASPINSSQTFSTAGVIPSDVFAETEETITSASTPNRLQRNRCRLIFISYFLSREARGLGRGPVVEPRWRRCKCCATPGCCRVGGRHIRSPCKKSRHPDGPGRCMVWDDAAWTPQVSPDRHDCRARDARNGEKAIMAQPYVWTGLSPDAVRRRRCTARAARPLPRSSMMPGSGTEPNWNTTSPLPCRSTLCPAA